MSIRPDNFLALEPLLIARLEERLDKKIRILSAADLEQVASNQQPTPSVAVLYSGYSLSANVSAGQRGAMSVHQRWLCVVCARNVTSLSGAQARFCAGAIIAAVIDALQGWRAGDGFGPMTLGDGANAEFSNGLFYLPLGWTVPIRNYLSCEEQP